MKRFFIALAALFLFAAQGSADEIYKIKKGDTLYKISRLYQISIKELCELNELKKTSKLRPGQTLIVGKAGSRICTVRKGDTIHKIAERFDMDVIELMVINQLESDTLKPGQKLFLEPPTEEDLSKINLEEDLKKISESEEILSMSVTDRLVLFAKKFIDMPYRFGGNTVFMGIDCSAYVQKVYKLIGIELPRSARLQFKEGEAVDRDSLSIGDLVFFKTYAAFPSHVGIYLGNDLFIHASATERKIKIDNMKTSYYIKRFIGAKRYISETEEKEKEEPSQEG